MTSLLVLRALEHVHGHLGWLALAALAHPAILLRSPGRRAPLAVLLASGLVVTAAVLGGWLYPDYRALVKPSLFRDAPAVGLAFERKEHLAVGVVAFSLVGCIAHVAAPAFGDAAARASVARLAHRAFVLAFVLGVVVGVLGVVVASVRTF